MKFLFLESFFGGSHQDFALGLKAHTGHDIDLVTLPARFWKWRMGGAALEFLSRVPSLAPYDGIIVTDMMNLTDFIALAGTGVPPVLLYFHENQFSYPLMPGEVRDYLFGLTNVTSALAARRVVFNSRFHQASFLEDADCFIRQMPDMRPGWVVDSIRQKSTVLYPGCRFPAGEPDLAVHDFESPVIIWNHRWEHDKNPEDFFTALKSVKSRGIPFRLALLGERYSKAPPVFSRIRSEFEPELVTSGYIESRDDYLRLLKQGSIVVSTALQENFGISVVEAVRMGCLPLLPRRLSYPEIIPQMFHPEVLYDSAEDLCERLGRILLDMKSRMGLRARLSASMATYSWENAIRIFDTELDALPAS
ncbi:MAG: DUF3524 domain-containing protein [Pseudomonadota bacterium]